MFNRQIGIGRDKDIHVRVANIKDIEQLRRLYLGLETDGVKYQSEHFTIGYRSDDFFNEIFENENQDIPVADAAGTVMGFAHVMVLKQKNAENFCQFFQKTLASLQNIMYTINCCGMIAMKREVAARQTAGFPWSECQVMKLATSHCTE